MNPLKQKTHPAVYATITGLALLNMTMVGGIAHFRKKNVLHNISQGQNLATPATFSTKLDYTLESKIDAPVFQEDFSAPDVPPPMPNTAIADYADSAIPPSVWQNPNTTDETFAGDTNYTLLARLLFGEVAQRSQQEQYAVGRVVLNRIGRSTRWPDLRSVILAERQFSCFNPSQRAIVMHPIREEIDGSAATILNTYDQIIWDRCLSNAHDIIDRNPNVTQHLADHYIHVETTPDEKGEIKLSDGNDLPDWADESRRVNLNIPAQEGVEIRLYQLRQTRN